MFTEYKEKQEGVQLSWLMLWEGSDPELEEEETSELEEEETSELEEEERSELEEEETSELEEEERSELEEEETSELEEEETSELEEETRTSSPPPHVHSSTRHDTHGVSAGEEHRATEAQVCVCGGEDAEAQVCVWRRGC
ncbi:hypothetical protein EYF80_055407 [Liparis tanakae]|uniref:Uncharacterized protein n=1 Tax=Liparis tanakae TaxID=230148 RepID=A0A4Z2EZL6_9TELE|nr:hypothetical protein EYF80_055407 [Liparis tanakae]